MARTLRRIRGFTLIEQLAVIAAVGATSALALPRLVEVQAQAEATALASLAGAAGSAMVLNQAACLVAGHRPSAGSCTPVADCADVAALLMADLPDGYRLLPGPLVAAGAPANGQLGPCQVLQVANGATASYTGLSAGQAAGR